MKKLLHAAALAIAMLAASAPSYAQQAIGYQGQVNGVTKVIPVTAANPLPVNATVEATASIAAFAPTGQAALSTTTSSARVALATVGPTAVVQNTGSNTAYVLFGSGSVTVTALTGYPVTAGATVAFDVGANTNIAGITSTGVTTLSITTGTGLPAVAGAGSGSGGGGGGAVTVVDGGDITQGAIADAACSTDNGTCSNNGLIKRTNQRLTTLNTTLGLPFQQGGSIGNTTFAATQSGTWNVTNVSGTVSLPTGAATAAKQPALGTAGSSSSDVISVQGIASGTALPVSAASLPLPSGAATSANQVAPKAEDAAHASGDNGYPVWTVRKDTATQLAGTDADYAPFITDASGRLWVNCGAGCSGTQYAEDAAHVSGDSGTLALVVRKDTAASLAGTDGDYTGLIVDATGHLHVNSVAVASAFADGWDVTQGTKADSAWTSGSGSVVALLKAIAGAAIDTSTPTPMKIDQTTDGTTNAVHLVAGTALAGKFGIDQTTPGTTNGVRPDTSGATASAVPTRADYMGAVSSGNLTGIVQADASAAISVSTATTTQLVALSSSKKIYVTSLDVIAGGTGNITFVYGTGSSCGTGTTSLTGAYNLTAQAGLAKGNGLGPVLVVPASNALCVTTSAAVQMSGSVAYTQF